MSRAHNRSATPSGASLPGRSPSPRTIADGSVFLVEDDPYLVDLIGVAMKQSGFPAALGIARDGLAAVEAVLAMRILPRVLLVDLNLRGCSGFEVLSRIRADPRATHLPIVFLTSSNVWNDRAEAYRRGATSFVEKPIDFVQFEHHQQTATLAA